MQKVRSSRHRQLMENARAIGYSFMESQVNRQASLLSYLTSFMIMSVVSVIAFFVTFLIKKKT